MQTKWDPENLYRHADFAPVKKEVPGGERELQPGLPPIKRETALGREESHEDEFGSP